MSVILNEDKWAEEMISNHSLGRRPFITLKRVARYYLDRGNNQTQVRKMLESFMLSCDSTTSLSKWSDAIDTALAKAKKEPAIKISHIDISEPEMEIIQQIEGRQAQRLAFTLLCLAKYRLIVNPNSGGWVNFKDSEIMNMANIKNSIKRQSAIYNLLNKTGYIEFSKRVDNTNVRVLNIISGKPVMQITDMRNLGYQYNNYCGEPGYMTCTMCGIMVRKTGRAHKKYCQDCAAIAQAQNIAKYVKNRGVQKSA